MPVTITDALSLETTLAALRAAGEETRLRLLALLGDGDLTVSDMTDILGQSQPRISRHLKLMHEAGLVDRYREGAFVFYALAAETNAAPLARTLLATLQRDDARLARDRARLAAVRAAKDQAAQSYFKGVAADWDRIRSLHVSEADVEAAILAAVGEKPVRAHLDVGTGTGRLLALFAPRTRRSVGVDASHDMLAVARANLDATPHRHAQVRPGDVYALPFEDRAFDLVTIHQVLHYLAEPARALAEAARVLAPGGKLVVVDFAPHEHEFLRAEHAHRRLGFADDQVADWLRAAGLAASPARHLAATGAAQGALTVTLWLAEAPAPAAAPAATVGVAA
jgi:ubiquinone/menaquinone biosynthesis C-methylase UbiE/DNA-binding transcriptional ArsR family regulator